VIKKCEIRSPLYQPLLIDQGHVWHAWADPYPTYTCQIFPTVHEPKYGNFKIWGSALANTHYANQGQIWHAIGDTRHPLPRQILPWSVYISWYITKHIWTILKIWRAPVPMPLYLTKFCTWKQTPQCTFVCQILSGSVYSVSCHPSVTYKPQILHFQLWHPMVATPNDVDRKLNVGIQLQTFLFNNIKTTLMSSSSVITVRHFRLASKRSF